MSHLLCLLILIQTLPIFAQIDSTVLNKYLPVKENNLWGYIDQTGEVMIKPQFQFVGKFSKDGFAIAQKNDKLGFIDQQGKVIIPFKYTKINYLRSNIFAVKAKKWGLFHKTQGQILPTEYDTIQAIYLVSNHKIVHQVMLCHKNAKVGAVNIKGKVLVEPQYDSLAFHSAKKDFLLSFNNSKMGLIHLENGEFIPANFDKISFLPFDYVRVYQSEKAGLYNNLGEFVIPCEYEGLQFYDQAIEKFILLNKKGYKGIYHIPKKRIVISCDREFNAIRDVESNDTSFKIFQVNSLKGMTAIDENGQQLLPLGNYDRLKYDKSGILYLKQGEVWGIYFQKTKRLLKPQFQDISSFVADLALVAKNNRWGIINIHGDILVQPLYKQNQFKITRNSIRIYTQNGVENLVLDENKKIIDRFRLKKLRSIKINDMPAFDFNLNPVERQDVLQSLRDNNRNSDPRPNPRDSTNVRNPRPANTRITQIPMASRMWQYLELERGWKLYDSTAQDYITRAYVNVEVNNSLNITKAVIKRQGGNELGHLYNNQNANILTDGRYKVDNILKDFEKGEIAQLEARQVWNDSLSPFFEEKVYFEYLQKDGTRQKSVTFLKNGRSEKSKEIAYNLPFEDNLSKFAITAKWETNIEVNENGIVLSEETELKKADNWGFINRQGKVIVEPKYRTLEYPNESGLIKLGKGKKLGIVDTLGKEILPEKYKNIDFVEEYELLVVKKGRKYGLNQYNGTLVLDTKYDFIDKEFSRDFAIIVEKDKYGLIDDKGKIVLQPQYDEILNFDSQGFARIRTDDKWGLLDDKLQVILEPSYHKIEMFDFRGFAKVRMIDTQESDSLGFWNVGIIDKSGKEIVAPLQDSVIYLNDSEYTAFRTIEVMNRENFGVIDKTGKLVIPYQFQNIRSFHHGIAAAQKNRLWGFIDTTGNYVIQPIYTSVNDFKEGIARVSARRKYGYVDTQGKLIFPCELSYAEDAEGSICRVRKNEKHGILDTKGNWIIEPKYDEILPFDEEEQAIVKIKDKTDFYYGIIDKQGKEILPCKYQELGRFYDGLAKVKNDNKYNFIDRKGKYFFKEFFEDMLNFYEGLAGFKKDDKWGFINPKGEIVIKAKYNEVHSFMNGFARIITKNRKLIYIDRNGKEYKKLPKDVVWFNQDIYLQVKPFKEGLAAAEASEGKWRYITNTGSKPFSGFFLEASNFYNGYAKVKTNDNKIYYINKKGKRFGALPRGVVWKDMEKEAKEKKMKQIQIEKAKKKMLEDLKPRISSQNFMENGLYGVVNQYGFVELNPKYNFLSKESESKRVVRKNYLYGITNIRGEKIIMPNCEQIQYLGQDIFRIEEGSKLGYWNYKKGWIWEMKN